MIKEETALFIGHSECYNVSSQAIENVIVDLINQGITVFLSAGCVHRLKKQYPHIKNYLVIPYLTFAIFDKDIFDEIIYPEGFEKYHFKAAIPARNKYMVENSSIAICFVNHGWGGAAQTYRRAIKNKLRIINIGTYEE